MAREINIGKNIQTLRKKSNITQEPLAEAVNVSPQAVSKWEKGASQPDTLIVPLIAEFFHVSIDYLYYGNLEIDDEICDVITKKITDCHISGENPYTESITFASAAQHGILRGIEKTDRECLRTKEVIPIKSDPLHLLDGRGLAISSPKGFCAILTDDFINSVNGRTVTRAGMIFEALADADCLRVTLEILNFNGISHIELKEVTQFDDDRLKKAVRKGMGGGFIKAMPTRHAILGCEYSIQRHHYNCLCLILSSIEMIDQSLKGFTCLMKYDKLSMTFDGTNEENN